MDQSDNSFGSMAVQRYDILWKSAIEDFPVEFLRFVYADADRLFDLSREIKFLNKELAELVPGPDPNTRNELIL